jgi:ubiquinone/menaquinone biosynthesis C-methylase UbiE
MPLQGDRLVLDFYDRHPINEQQVLAALRGRGVDAQAPAVEDLFPWDQDHYGGLAAVDALARRAAIGPGSRVLDVCCGLGGPARFLAHGHGARVVGIDLNAGRAAGARRLTALVRLGRLVRFARADARALPFGAGSFTAVVSQEALLHVPEKAAVLAECRRVLATGGRIAFTDWIARPRLDAGERRRLEDWMAAVTLQTPAGYREMLARAGFHAIESEDLSADWIDILRERQRMYRALRAHTVARLGAARYEEYTQLYEFFVGLVVAGKLGGGRFTATAGPGGA